MQITNHFSLTEFIFSQTATRLGKDVVIDLDSHVHRNVIALCAHVLEPLRTTIDKPVRITSGYRPVWLNRKIGGSAKSQHCLGQAADIVVPGMEPMAVAEVIASMDIEYDQCIVEFGRWVHISYVRGKNRNKMMRASRSPDGTTRYSLLALQGVTV